MTFLSLIGALLLEQWRPLRTGNRLYVAFARYVNRIGQNFNAGQYRDGVISWVLAILPVALITFVVYSVRATSTVCSRSRGTSSSCIWRRLRPVQQFLQRRDASRCEPAIAPSARDC